jgi:hypothetical protein
MPPGVGRSWGTSQTGSPDAAALRNMLPFCPIEFQQVSSVLPPFCTSHATYMKYIDTNLCASNLVGSLGLELSSIASTTILSKSSCNSSPLNQLAFRSNPCHSCSLYLLGYKLQLHQSDASSVDDQPRNSCHHVRDLFVVEDKQICHPIEPFF